MKKLLYELLCGKYQELPIEEILQLDLGEEIIPVDVKGSFQVEGGRIHCEFDAHLERMKACDRCLEPVRVLTAFHYEEFIEREAIEDFDFSDLLRQEVILHEPSKILCAEDCQGLCPDCGINLNEESCDCQAQKIDVRFSALQKLLKK